MSFDRFTYYRMMEEKFKELEKLPNKPSLLLHSCCGPCNAYPLQLLIKYFDVTLMYNNSNIYPSEEYQRRLDELLRYVDYVNNKFNVNIKLIETKYDNISFNEKLKPYKDYKEGDKRCFLCYELRMDEAYKYASENGFDYFTTVMTISRQKDSIILNDIGIKLSEKYPNTQYFISDFKKNKGIDKGLEIAKELNMYRQTYCGCVYSFQNSKNKKGD